MINISLRSRVIALLLISWNKKGRANSESYFNICNKIIELGGEEVKDDWFVQAIAGGNSKFPEDVLDVALRYIEKQYPGLTEHLESL